MGRASFLDMCAGARGRAGEDRPRGLEDRNERRNAGKQLKIVSILRHLKVRGDARKRGKKGVGKN